jgi:hypothetical protein
MTFLSKKRAESGRRNAMFPIYKPYHINDAVLVIAQGEHMNKDGRVTRREPEDSYYAEGTTYFVTFAGETEECKQPFGYWDLEPTGEKGQ